MVFKLYFADFNFTVEQKKSFSWHFNFKVFQRQPRDCENFMTRKFYALKQYFPQVGKMKWSKISTGYHYYDIRNRFEPKSFYLQTETLLSLMPLQSILVFKILSFCYILKSVSFENSFNVRGTTSNERWTSSLKDLNVAWNHE